MSGDAFPQELSKTNQKALQINDPSNPSIWDIYSAANKLLVLQPRIENRNWRESSKNVQKGFNVDRDSKVPEDLKISFGTDTMTGGSPTTEVSPISMDLSNKDSVESSSSFEFPVHAEVTHSTAEKKHSLNSTVTPSNLTKGLKSNSGSSDHNGTMKFGEVSQNIGNHEMDMIWGFNIDDSSNNIELNLNQKVIKFGDFKQEIASFPMNQQQTPQQIISPQKLQQRALSHQTSHSLPTTTQSSFQNIPQAKPITKAGPASISRNSSSSSLLSSSSQSFSKKKLPANSVNSNTVCFNCHTQKTPLWRRDPSGNTLCNACGLFQKLHGTMRPLSLKTDVIKKRNSRRSSVSRRPPGPTHPSSDKSKIMTGLDKVGINMFTPISNSNSPLSPNDISNNNTSNFNNRQKNILILPKPSSSVPTTTQPIRKISKKPTSRSNSNSNSPFETMGLSPQNFQCGFQTSTVNTPSPITMPSPISPSLSNSIPTSNSTSANNAAAIMAGSFPLNKSSSNLAASFNQKRIPQNFQQHLNHINKFGVAGVAESLGSQVGSLSHGSFDSSNASYLAKDYGNTVGSQSTFRTHKSFIDSANLANGGDSFSEFVMDTSNSHYFNAVDNDLIMEDSLMGDGLDWLKFDT